MQEPFSEAFVRTNPFGILAGVRLPDATRASTLAGGRTAFWRAARELGIPPGELPIGERGEPLLPAGLAGSISHKETLAIALVARSAPGTVGVDLETLSPPRPAIADIALRPEERAALGLLPESDRWLALVTAFAVKEALYKALHPHLQRYVRYDEAAVTRAPDGVLEIRLHLDGGVRFGVEIHVEPNVENHVLACIRVSGPERGG